MFGKQIFNQRIRALFYTKSSRQASSNYKDLSQVKEVTADEQSVFMKTMQKGQEISKVYERDQSEKPTLGDKEELAQDSQRLYEKMKNPMMDSSSNKTNNLSQERMDDDGCAQDLSVMEKDFSDDSYKITAVDKIDNRDQQQ